MPTEISREQEDRLESNIIAVKESIKAACLRCQRDPKEITLVAVSKTVGPELIALAFDLGIQIFGESRPQVLRQKVDWLAENRPDLAGKLRWHMIGHLQRNKARQTVDHATLIHSVDSQRLAEKINEISLERGVQSSILAQIKLSGEDSKFGVDLSSAEVFVNELLQLPGLDLRGLMGMASFVADEAIIRKEFSSLRSLFDKLGSKWPVPGILSMGMSSDFEWAIEEGATHVRVGSSLFSF